MPTTRRARDAIRVLGLHPHGRQTGRVVLDRFGLVPDSPRTFETRRWRSVEDIVEEAIAAFRPTVIAIAHAPSAGRDPVRRALEVAALHDVPVRRCPLEELTELLHAPGIRGCDRLGQSVIRGFLPELGHTIRSWKRADSSMERRRLLRPVWSAAAAALLAFAERHPRAAAALATRHAPPAFWCLIARTEHTLHPHL